MKRDLQRKNETSADEDVRKMTGVAAAFAVLSPTATLVAITITITMSVMGDTGVAMVMEVVTGVAMVMGVVTGVAMMAAIAAAAISSVATTELMSYYRVIAASRIFLFV